MISEISTNDSGALWDGIHLLLLFAFQRWMEKLPRKVHRRRTDGSHSHGCPLPSSKQHKKVHIFTE
jgi:hypothetical protein